MQLRIVLSSACHSNFKSPILMASSVSVNVLSPFSVTNGTTSLSSAIRVPFRVTAINSVYQPSLRKVPATGVLHRSSGSAVVAESTIERFTASRFTQSAAQQLLVPVGEVVDAIG